MAFTDSFTRSDEDLETSANWTRVDGAAGAAAVRSNQVAFLSTTDSGYQCPNQSSADHYTQIVRSTAASRNYFECCVRLTDKDNWIGARAAAGDAQLYKRDTGSFTSLGSYTYTFSIGDTYRLEVSGNDFDLILNGTSRVTNTDAFNNTEQRQGMCPRSVTENPALDDFEAGTIGAAGATGKSNPFNGPFGGPFSGAIS